MAKSITPGFHSAAHREAFLAAARAFREAKRFRYCKATAKSGNRCRGFAMRGTDFCAMHAHPDVKRERRQKRLARLRSPEQIERFNRREAARIQREIWRRDRWAPGGTIFLGRRETEFQADMASLGFNAGWLSPATIDQARWCWLNMQFGRLTREQLADRIRSHQGRD